MVLVKSVKKTKGFGNKTAPQVLAESELQVVFSQLEVEFKNSSTSSLYGGGDEVLVTDGLFDSFSGVVEKVDDKGQK